LILRVVVDTNVLVSGLLTVGGPPARVLDFVRDGQVIPLVNNRILDEYARVLARPKFRQSIQTAQAEDLVALFSSFGEFVPAQLVAARFKGQTGAAGELVEAMSVGRAADLVDRDGADCLELG